MQGGYCFKYGSLRVRGYISIGERMMESIENNLRCLTYIRHIPCYIVRTIYNLYPGVDYVAGMIQPPIPPRKEHDKEGHTKVWESMVKMSGKKV